MSFPGGHEPAGGAYGPAGYVVGFGNFEAPQETLEDQRTRLQQKAGRFSPDVEDDDLGEMDWTVTYIDMVTLLMIFFVVLSFLAMVSKDTRLNTERVEQVVEAPVATTPPQTAAIPEGAYSPFDGHGFTLVEGGMPANRDNIHSRYDDPDSDGQGTTDPSPPDRPAPPPPTPSEQPPPPAQPPQTGLVQGAQVPPLPQPQGSASVTADGPLAQQLQQMVQQNDLAGQVEVISSAQAVIVRIADRILFASGRAGLEVSGVELVRRLAPVLAKAGSTISIEGHTDNVPISTFVYPSNWELSAARAATVLRQLVDLGLPPGRLRAIAYADTHPVVPNDTPEHRAQNRRVELVIASGTSP